jgi:hypothetical protein
LEQQSTFRQIKQLDASCHGIQCEHWITLAAGLAVWWLTRNHSSFIDRTAGMVMGTALVGRAANGRNGIAKALRFLTLRRGVNRLWLNSGGLQALRTPRTTQWFSVN